MHDWRPAAADLSITGAGHHRGKLVEGRSGDWLALALGRAGRRRPARFHTARGRAEATPSRPARQRSVPFRLRADGQRRPNAADQPLADRRADSFESGAGIRPRVPRTSPADAWQRRVLLAVDSRVNLDAEPRPQAIATDETPKGGHPFFWPVICWSIAAPSPKNGAETRRTGHPRKKARQTGRKGRAAAKNPSQNNRGLSRKTSIAQINDSTPLGHGAACGRCLRPARSLPPARAGRSGTRPPKPKLTADTIADLGEVVRLVESAVQKGLDKKDIEWANKLLSSTLNPAGQRDGPPTCLPTAVSLEDFSQVAAIRPGRFGKGREARLETGPAVSLDRQLKDSPGGGEVKESLSGARQGHRAKRRTIQPSRSRRFDYGPISRKTPRKTCRFQRGRETGAPRRRRRPRRAWRWPT